MLYVELFEKLKMNNLLDKIFIINGANNYTLAILEKSWKIERFCRSLSELYSEIYDLEFAAGIDTLGMTMKVTCNESEIRYKI